MLVAYGTPEEVAEIPFLIPAVIKKELYKFSSIHLEDINGFMLRITSVPVSEMKERAAIRLRRKNAG